MKQLGEKNSTCKIIFFEANGLILQVISNGYILGEILVGPIFFTNFEIKKISPQRLPLEGSIPTGIPFHQNPQRIQEFPNITSWWLNQPIWKKLVKLDHLPTNRGEHKQLFETTTYINCWWFGFVRVCSFRVMLEKFLAPRHFQLFVLDINVQQLRSCQGPMGST